MPAPTKNDIILAVQKIVAKAANQPDPTQVQAGWHLHSPWPPIGMDSIRLDSMLPDLNTLIQTYKPANSVQASDLDSLDFVLDLLNLVWSKVTP